jgi:hypothetical protein
VFPRDIVCLRNISTLHKGDDDYDDDDDDDDNNNNNNNKQLHNDSLKCTVPELVLFPIRLLL